MQQQPIIKSDTYWPPRRPLPLCSGACNQGRQPCQQSHICAPEDDGEPMQPREDAFFVGLILAACGLLGYLAWLLWSTVKVL